MHAAQIMPSREFPIPVAHNKHIHTPFRREKPTATTNMHTTAWHHTHTKSLSSRKQSTYFSIAQSEKKTHTNCLWVVSDARNIVNKWQSTYKSVWLCGWIVGMPKYKCITHSIFVESTLLCDKLHILYISGGSQKLNGIILLVSIRKFSSFHAAVATAIVAFYASMSYCVRTT